MTRLKRYLREELAFRIYKIGRRLVERAHRLDDTLPTETRPGLNSLAYALDNIGLRPSEVFKLAEERAHASGQTLGDVMSRPNSERLLPR